MRDSRREKHSNPQRLLAVGIGCSTLASATVVLGLPAEAQISGDGSFGTLVNGALTDNCTDAICTITGGTINSSGSTLLHSFEQFTSPESAPGSSALFIDPGVRDIIVRVTGGNPSFLNNTLQTSQGSTANLFFANPSGIIFGPSAQLDIGGSFFASTANEIIFAEGTVLPTGDATSINNELLTISAPIGLGFLPDRNRGTIAVRGNGNRLTFGAPETPNSQFVNRIFRQPLPPSAPFPPLPPISELAVRPGQTLALVANGIQIEGGNLTALGGQIELGSIASGTALITADSSLDYSQIDQFSDISLIDNASIEVSSSSSGTIRLRGQNIGILDSSALLAETLPLAPLSPLTSASSSGVIDIVASDKIEVGGFTAEPTPFAPPFFTNLSVSAAPNSTGNGGLLKLQAKELTVDDGGQISATAYGFGNGGQIDLDIASAVTLTGGSSFGPSGLFAVAEDTGSGNSGQISVETDRFQMNRGAQIASSNLTSGTSGSIDVTAKQIDIVGTSEVTEVLTSEGIISTVIPTAIRADMSPFSPGKGEPIRLTAETISLSEGAEILTANLGAAEASDIKIDANEVTVSGRARLGDEVPSRISTQVAIGATGRGGNLNLETGRLQILDTAQVGTSTSGPGRAGDLSIEASQSVLVSGQTSLGRSGLFANAINSTGAGGNLSVETKTLRITDGGTLNVSNFPSGTNAQLPPGQGDAGNLRVDARRILLSEGGVIRADTAAGDRGNITLTTQALTLRQNSLIAANATGTATGGNITINAPNGFIVAVPDENSDITANAVFGNGGRIDITAQNVIGIEPRPVLTPQSDITTSSEFGLSGETLIKTPDTELRAENTPLPQSTDVPLVAQGCNATGTTNSRFVQSGKGGLSNSPYGTIDSHETLSDTSLPSSLSISSTQTENSPTTNRESSPNIVPEAQGWSTNPQGEVVLLATEILEADRCISWQ